MNEVQQRQASPELPVTGGSRTLQTQADRLRWEREWLQQNRRAPGDDSSVGVTWRSVDVEPQPHIFEPASTAEWLQAAMRTPARLAVSISAAATGSETEPTRVVVAVTRAPAALAAAIPGMAQQSIPAGDLAASTATVGDGSFRRGTVQYYAAWETPEGMGLALRLPLQLQNDRQTLWMVRQWLRDWGRKLAVFIINGTEQWRRAPPPDGY